MRGDGDAVHQDAHTGRETLYKIHVDKVVWAAGLSGTKSETEARKRLGRIIKASHDKLFNTSAIVGAMAMKDIMRLLCLCLLQPHPAESE